MTKFERAVRAAEALPPEARERLGDNVLQFVDRYLALTSDLEQGLAELDAGLGIPAEEVFAELRARIGLRD